MGKSESNVSVVCDAGPVIHLREIERLFLLRDFGKVLVPGGVVAEVHTHVRVDFEDNAIPWHLTQAHDPLSPDAEAMSDAFSLDRGEREVLSPYISRVVSRPYFCPNFSVLRAAAVYPRSRGISKLAFRRALCRLPFIRWELPSNPSLTSDL